MAVGAFRVPLNEPRAWVHDDTGEPAHVASGVRRFDLVETLCGTRVKAANIERAVEPGRACRYCLNRLTEERIARPRA